MKMFLEYIKINFGLNFEPDHKIPKTIPLKTLDNNLAKIMPQHTKIVPLIFKLLMPYFFGNGHHGIKRYLKIIILLNRLPKNKISELCKLFSYFLLQLYTKGIIFTM